MIVLNGITCDSNGLTKKFELFILLEENSDAFKGIQLEETDCDLKDFASITQYIEENPSKLNLVCGMIEEQIRYHTLYKEKAKIGYAELRQEQCPEFLGHERILTGKFPRRRDYSSKCLYHGSIVDDPNLSEAVATVLQHQDTNSIWKGLQSEQNNSNKQKALKRSLF